MVKEPGEPIYEDRQEKLRTLVTEDLKELPADRLQEYLDTMGAVDIGVGPAITRVLPGEFPPEYQADVEIAFSIYRAIKNLIKEKREQEK
ncbi:MAG: hypothetical protein NTV36_02585 [Candidatus Staskawiczbacteria bacterium]|nr:hypothetical protein [Candidatus Staskawiczbacteria bacterium]